MLSRAGNTARKVPPLIARSNALVRRPTEHAASKISPSAGIFQRTGIYIRRASTEVSIESILVSSPPVLPTTKEQIEQPSKLLPDLPVTLEKAIDTILSHEGPLVLAQIRPTIDLMETLCAHKQGKITKRQAIETAVKLFERCLDTDDWTQLNRGWRILLQGYARLEVEYGPDKYPFQVARSSLQRMLDLHRENPKRCPPPNDKHYGSVLYACANNVEAFEAAAENFPDASAQAIETAEALIRTLETPDSPVQPTTEMYNNVVLAHANRAVTIYGAATAAEDWLMHMSERAAEGANVHPTADTFNRVLKAWSLCQERQGAARAAEILQLMMELGVENRKVLPDTVSFSTVISAFGNRQQPEHCQAILEEAVDFFSKSSVDGEPPTELTQIWNATGWSWANSGYPDSAERVEALLTSARELDGTAVCVMPSRALHAACFSAYIKSNRPNGIELGEKHLRSMISAFEKDRRRNVSPTAIEFNTVIHAWNKSEGNSKQQSSNDRGNLRSLEHAASRATALLRIMIELSEGKNFPCAPDKGTFNMCIELWRRTSNACVDATNFMQVSNGGSPATKAPSAPSARDEAISAVKNADELLHQAEQRRIADGLSYSHVINALCNLGLPHSVFYATTILGRLETESDKSHLEWPRHAVGLYTTVISALAKVGTTEAAKLAVKVLRGMPKTGKRAVHATVKTYTSTVVSLSKLKGAGSGDLAFQIFEEMKALDEDSNSKVYLDVVAFEQILWALTTAGDRVSAGRSCEVLNYMLELHLSGRANIEPTAKCFNACVRALTQNQDASHTNFAADLLEMAVRKNDYKQLSNLPPPSAFLTVIQACKDCGMDKRANKIAQTVESLIRCARQSQTDSNS